MDPPRQDDLKRAAAERAVAEVMDGMVVGLGSGSTADFATAALAARIAKGLRAVVIPTSTKTGRLARSLGVSLSNFARHRRIDLTIDGADQVERGTLALMKGWGGALLREKIVASVSDRMIVVVDETKLVDRLGNGKSLPVEVVAFGWQTIVDRLARLDCLPSMRLADGHPFVTDGGNHIIDCAIAEFPDPVAFDKRLSAVVGVIATGLFVGMASEIVVGRPGGVDVMVRR